MNCWTSTAISCSLSAAFFAALLSFLSAAQFCDFVDTYRSSLASPLFPIASLLHLLHQNLCNAGSTHHERDAWNLFYHLGGNGPWIEKTNARFGTYGKKGKVPLDCAVDQVHMLSRHAERFPTTNAGSRHLPLLSRLETLSLNGSLSFLNDGNWTYFTPPSNSHERTFEDLTSTSRYAGTLSAFALGTTFRTRYSHLLTINSQKPVNFWSASSPRDVETALYFADGLFGRDWSLPNATNPAKLHVIPETAVGGGNTLTPGDSCLDYRTDSVSGHDQGYTKLAEWQDVFTRPISARLAAANPALNPPLSPAEVYSMMELCGFELLVRGSSPWCQVFSQSEWEDFEYARDLLHFYRAGPGNRYAKAMGHLWLNATADLLGLPSIPPPLAHQNHGQAADELTTTTTTANAGTGQIYASFVHDGDIIPVLAALGIFDEDTIQHHQQQQQHLPTEHIKRDRNWRTSDIVPMAGHLIIERLNCRTPHGWHYRDVRLVINDGWIGWPVVPADSRADQDANPTSVERRGSDKKRENKDQQNTKKKKKKIFIPQMDVNRFVGMIRHPHRDGQAADQFDLRRVCGLDEMAERRITFLHQ